MLYQEYIVENKSQSEVADSLGCSISIVFKWLKRHNISKSVDRPWRDKNIMEELYEKHETQRDLANELDCGLTTVCRWLDKHGIEKREADLEKLRDGDWMYRKYWGEKYSTTEIAEEIGCSQPVVSDWLNKHNIDTRKPNHEKVPCYATDKYGYERWSTLVVDESYYTVSVHRLLMVAECGFDAVCGMEVHHKNEIKWDNRVENLELMTEHEHKSHHAPKKVPSGDGS